LAAATINVVLPRCNAAVAQQQTSSIVMMSAVHETGFAVFFRVEWGLDHETASVGNSGARCAAGHYWGARRGRPGCLRSAGAVGADHQFRYELPADFGRRRLR